MSVSPGDLTVDISRRFPGGPQITAQFSMPTSPASVTVLFGPSGCGKSTILRALAGLESPDTGTIRFADSLWFDSNTTRNLPPQQRSIGYLVQDFFLFPHLTVAANILFGIGHLAAEKQQQRLHHWGTQFELESIFDRMPSQISGGQRQRVALARALATSPRLLLLDEPMSSLDSLTSERVQRSLKNWLDEAGIPAVLVTHDRREAMALADQILLMHDGAIIQSGSAAAVFGRPNSVQAAQLVGTDIIEPATVEQNDEGMAKLRLGNPTSPVFLSAPTSAQPGQSVLIALRAEDVILETRHAAAAAGVSVRNRLSATVTQIRAEGPLVRAELNAGFPLRALITRSACEDLNLHEGTLLVAAIKATAIHVIPQRTSDSRKTLQTNER